MGSLSGSLSVYALCKHLNILHVSGIWTSQHSNIMVLTDAIVVLIINCYLSSGEMSHEAIKKQDNIYTDQLHDPRQDLHNYVSMPKILNKPVKDVPVHLDEIGLSTIHENAPIQEHLAHLLECEVTECRRQIGQWICDYYPEIPIITSWLAIHGLDVEEYITLLSQGREVDGLEVWVASVALGRPLNIVFETTVWSTVASGFDHAFPLLVLTSHASALLCVEEQISDNEDLLHLGAAAAPVGSHKKKGHPVTSTVPFPVQPNSEHMDTDTEELLRAES